MKKISSLLMALALLFLSTTGLIHAADFDVSTVITPATSTIEQGQTVDLTALTSGWSGNGKLVEEQWSSNVTVLAPAVEGPAAFFESTARFDATGLAPGTYHVTYSITISRGASSNTGTAEDEAEIIVIEASQTIVIEPMAAPAVAAKILKFNDVKPSFKAGKQSGNFIADTAHHMGPRTLFNDVEKSIEVDGIEVSNPAYRQEVLDFLNHHPDMKTVLLMPDDAYFTEP